MISIVLLTLSLHTEQNSMLNNQNYGIGVEYSSNLTYGIYDYQNSYDKRSLMISIGKQYDFYGFGLAAANGYEQDKNNKNGWLVSPELTVKYKNIRLKTTAPFGWTYGTYDVVNLQFTYDLN